VAKVVGVDIWIDRFIRNEFDIIRVFGKYSVLHRRGALACDYGTLK
jgi:hypothetical protein